jgi:hypothetical protein
VNFVIRHALRFLAATILTGVLAASASAATYYARVTGVPSTIACTDTNFTFGTGATLAWNFASVSSVSDITLRINGAVVGTGSGALGAVTSSTTGTIDLQVVTANTVAPYPSTPYPYTVNYALEPQDPDTDGVSVSFTCTSTGGTGFSVTVIPAKLPAFVTTPGTVSFPATNVGATSAPVDVTVTNSGTADATGVTFAGNNPADFGITGTTCGATIAKGASCVLTLVFKPSVGGIRLGNVSINPAVGPSGKVNVNGTGLTQLQMPATVNLGAQNVGTTSAPANLTVTNSSGTAVTVSSVTSSSAAEFPVTTNCATVAAGASCTITVSFKPTAANARTSTITVTSDGIGSPQAINASGTGLAVTTPGQLTMATTLTFATQTVGTTSAPSNIVVTNTGGTAVVVSSIVSSAPAEFAVSNTGCTTVNAGATCTISVTFAPAAAGARAATITVTSNGGGSPQVINASGTGTMTPTPGHLTMAPTVSFGTQTVGTTSAATNVTVTNTGGSAVTIASVASSVPAEFAVSSPGCTTLAPGATCAIAVTFAPAAAGARAATITVTSSGTGSPQAIAASGTGSAAATTGQLAIQDAVAFGTVVLGTSSPATVVSATNIGSAPVQVTSIVSSNAAEFAVSASTCGVVSPGAACSFNLTFTPASVSDRTAAITVTGDGVGSPQVVIATGKGATTPPPPPATVELIEYHHAEWDHYFMTGIPDEITKLDNGTFVGWARTGYKFKSYPLGTAASNVVCRFFSTSFAPRSSHFYTPFGGECAIVKLNPDWSFEGEVFNIPVPNVEGVCAAGTVPVYRLYNNGQGAAPNHRYTTDLAVRTQMMATGWVPEGYGPLGVIMCAPI